MWGKIVGITAKDLVGPQVEYNFHSTDFSKMMPTQTPLHIDVIANFGEIWGETEGTGTDHS